MDDTAVYRPYPHYIHPGDHAVAANADGTDPIGDRPVGCEFSASDIACLDNPLNDPHREMCWAHSLGYPAIERLKGLAEFLGIERALNSTKSF